MEFRKIYDLSKSARSPGRRVLDDFVIDEISAVDKPAQEHAVAVLMKRGETCIVEPTNVAAAARGAVPASFEDAVAAIRAADECSYIDAMRKAASRYPDLLAKYQYVTEAASAVLKGTTPLAVREFEALVDEVMAKRRLPRSAAMTSVRRENPEAFARYQKAY